MSNVYSGAYTLENATGADFEVSRVKVLDILQDCAKGNVSLAEAKINAVMSE